MAKIQDGGQFYSQNAYTDRVNSTYPLWRHIIIRNIFEGVLVSIPSNKKVPLEILWLTTFSRPFLLILLWIKSQFFDKIGNIVNNSSDPFYCETLSMLNAVKPSVFFSKLCINGWNWRWQPFLLDWFRFPDICILSMHGTENA